jgi:DNA polymerase
MLLSIGLSREKNCFIANIVKCRPPGNRDPLPEEIEKCVPFLDSQISVLKPRLILSAGRISAGTLLKTSEGITRIRGVWETYKGVPILPTFHPSFLLRDESQKQHAWEDIKSLCRRLCEIDDTYKKETTDLRRMHKI